MSVEFASARSADLAGPATDAAPRCATSARVRTHVLAGIGSLCLVDFDPATFDASHYAMHAIERPATIARSVPKRQAEFFHGRLAARHALALLGISNRNIPIGESRQPIWPAGVLGSISHAASTAAAVAIDGAGRGGIGIDVEQIVVPSLGRVLTDIVVNADELARLQVLASTLPLDALLTIVFSAKESFFKATFGAVGRYFDFNAVSVVDVNPQDGVVSLAVTQTLCPEFVARQVSRVRFEFIRSDLVLTAFVW
jgi:enterobactin synthetase component D